jgi:hypothetical protein
MLKNYLKNVLTPALVTVMVLAAGEFVAQSTPTTVTYTFTGSAVSFTVPPCITTISVDVRGAKGGTGYQPYSPGGNGGRVTGVLSTTPGQVLEIRVGGLGANATSSGVGGAGGYNGGGLGASYPSSYGGGGGGGASDIRVSPFALANRVIVAGGGGGGAYNYSSNNYDRGGDGGGTTGQAGFSGSVSATGAGGYGGTQTAGGGGGFWTSYCTAASGSLGLGAPGGTCTNSGGGGGGGYYGGGGGVWGGGGGGSSYANSSSVTSVVHTQGFSTGAGTVILTYSMTGLPISFTATPQPLQICTGNSATLAASGGTAYAWSTSGGTFATTSSVVVSPTTTTTYSIAGTNTMGCTTTAVATVTVDVGLPVLTVANTSSATSGICPGQTVMLTATGANTYTWSGGPVPVTNGVAFSPSVTSGYTVTGTNMCGSSTASASIPVYPAPVLTVAVTSPSICSGNTVMLTASGATSYAWSHSVTNGAAFSPTVTNVYTVTASNGTCTTFATQQVSVVLTPSVAPTAASFSICSGKTMTIVASGATGYTWNPLGTNNNSIVVSPSVTTQYTLDRANGTCTNSSIVTLTVHTTPTVGATVSQNTICSGNTLTFTGTGTNVCSGCYTWTAANGFNPTNGSAYFPNGTQSYTVMGASAQGCTAIAVTQVTVVQTPLALPVATPTAICIGKSATVTAFGASVYSWSPVGTFTGATTSSIIVNPTSSTTYTVTKSNANCVDVKTITLVVNPLPFLFTVASPTTVCAGKPAGLQVGGGNTYTWTSSPTTTVASGSSANNVTVFPNVTTDYTVTGFDGNCTNTAVVQVSVNPNPTISVAHTGTRICLLQCTTFTLNGGDTYTWSTTPPGPAPNGNTIATICPTTSTNYSLSGTNQFSCTSAIQQVVVVDPLPAITTTITKPLVCSTFSSELIANGTPGPVSYNWSTGSNLNKTTVNPVTSSCYVVTVTINATGCKDTRTLCVNVYQPTFAVTPDTSICFGGGITICVFGAQSNTWTNVNPASNFNCITVSPTVETTYMVSAAQTSNNVQCVGTNSVTVGIYAQPTVTAIAERTTICRGDAVNLIGGGVSQYLWSNSMSGATISVSPNNITTYTVWGTDIYGCKDTNQVTVRVSACPGWAEHALENQFSVYPNPNAGTFVVEAGKANTLRLFNELGQMIRVIELNDLNGLKAEVSGLSNGIYFLNATGEAGSGGYKIVVGGK